MNYVTSKMSIVASALVVMGSFGLVSTAEARASTKIWDPAYGEPLNDLGWSGQVTFDIADSCLDKVPSTGWIDNYSTKGCFNKLSITSATVTLYDLNSLTNSPSATLSYGSQFFVDYNAPLALRMYIEDDDVKAVQGGFLFPEFTKASEFPFATAVGYDYSAFWLSFNANSDNSFSLSSTEPPENGYAFLTNCSFNGKNDGPRGTESSKSFSASHPGVACSQNGYGEANQAILRPIPEPETYLLALASFGVLGIWARRRRVSAS